MVSPQSIQAYHEILADGTVRSKKARILKLVERIGGRTRRQLSQITGYELGTVAGRVNELIAEQKLEEVSTEVDPITNKNVGVVDRPTQGQKELF